MARHGTATIGAATFSMAVGILAAAGCSMGASAPADAAVWEASFAKDGAGALDGRRFVVEVTAAGKSDTEEETLEFHGGRFHSVACDEYGFTSGAYIAAKTGAALSFHAETTSEKEGRILWRGSIQDDAIEGGFTWTKSGQAPVLYTFTGHRK